ncbi:malate:quinone oxidoreductase [Rhodococcus sp. X156]|uniref:malate:quinone oxidoreductase n=1 Tax=Rhodococcus sp. X156 TaxID=2499145 RepID=UPI000FDB4A0D|nr:malate:quinone oxidoreductase [Rhodococcus sp. X156]
MQNTTGTEADVDQDVILIGGGIMSATLGAMIKQLQPDWSISVYERLDAVAQESSDAWNNAGTGHSALCELNYTPQKPDGSIDITKALSINEELQVSKQFWAYLVDSGLISKPKEFINPVPHNSFVRGEKSVAFLRKRYELLHDHPLFEGMEYTEDPEIIAKWAPLMMVDRDPSEPIAMTRVETGTDVNFGALTRQLISYLEESGASVQVRHEVRNLKRRPQGGWNVTVKDLSTGERKTVSARFVFIGSGGGALHLLQKSGIPEGKGLAGFPVGGRFLRCTNPEVVAQHHAKVYGQEEVGAPPMSVPHLDTRVIDGQRDLLFGPYAGFSPKFLKNGSVLDLPSSVKPNNLIPMLSVALHNLSLVIYLIGQLLQTPKARLKTLQNFVPTAKLEDWELVTAGQRVQVIKPGTETRGVLQFGTELVHSADGTVAALLGASPGASTAVPVMIRLLTQCFPDKIDGWKPQLETMVPSYGKKLAEHPELLKTVHSTTAAELELDTDRQAEQLSA